MPHTPKVIFVALCLMGIVVIMVGACLEVVRSRRGESVITVNQLRLRVMSAVVWLIVLGSLAYAVLFLWPEPGNLKQARQFLSVVSGVLILIVIAMGLLLYDVWQVSAARRRHEARFNTQLANLARLETARVQGTRGISAGSGSPEIAVPPEGNAPLE